MEFHLDKGHAAYQIQSYQPGKIRINENVYQSNVIIFGDRLICPWQLEHKNEIHADDMIYLTEFAPDVILLGTGNHLRFPAQQILMSCYQKNIGVEIMNSASACRTYSVLSNEGRRVLAAIIIEQP